MLLPVVKAGVVTVVLFAFITSWNEFLAALIFMNKETQFTIPIWTVSVRTGRLGAVDWGALQASIMIAILPCVLDLRAPAEILCVGIPFRRGEMTGGQRRGRTSALPAFQIRGISTAEKLFLIRWPPGSGRTATVHETGEKLF